MAVATTESANVLARQLLWKRRVCMCRPSRRVFHVLNIDSLINLV